MNAAATDAQDSRFEPTHYERLKVMPDAPADVIRAAYRALASRHHPDRAGAEANRKMAAINAAYAVLADPQRRAEYDASLALLAVGGAHAAPAPGDLTLDVPPTGFADHSALGSILDDDNPSTQAGARVEVGWAMPAPPTPRRRHRREMQAVAAFVALAAAAGLLISARQNERARAELALTSHLRQLPVQPLALDQATINQGLPAATQLPPLDAAAASGAASSAAMVLDIEGLAASAPPGAGPLADGEAGEAAATDEAAANAAAQTTPQSPAAAATATATTAAATPQPPAQGGAQPAPLGAVLSDEGDAYLPASTANASSAAGQHGGSAAPAAGQGAAPLRVLMPPTARRPGAPELQLDATLALPAQRRPR